MVRRSNRTRERNQKKRRALGFFFPEGTIDTPDFPGFGCYKPTVPGWKLLERTRTSVVPQDVTRRDPFRPLPLEIQQLIIENFIAQQRVCRAGYDMQWAYSLPLTPLLQASQYFASSCRPCIYRHVEPRTSAGMLGFLKNAQPECLKFIETFQFDFSDYPIRPDNPTLLAAQIQYGVSSLVRRIEGNAKGNESESELYPVKARFNLKFTSPITLGSAARFNVDKIVIEGGLLSQMSWIDRELNKVDLRGSSERRTKAGLRPTTLIIDMVSAYFRLGQDDFWRTPSFSGPWDVIYRIDFARLEKSKTPNEYGFWDEDSIWNPWNVKIDPIFDPWEIGPDPSIDPAVETQDVYTPNIFLKIARLLRDDPRSSIEIRLRERVYKHALCSNRMGTKRHPRIKLIGVCDGVCKEIADKTMYCRALTECLAFDEDATDEQVCALFTTWNMVLVEDGSPKGVLGSGE